MIIQKGVTKNAYTEKCYKEYLDTNILDHMIENC